ncbi:TetR/AcrR family transcriptional regulator [Oceanobacillus piezotolerans]|uniref:TetR/AcrR family transcriptional regulator n=1 Tax=Oceanobacillus piezotolerans TaxID=2448030 RepID=A0A498D990_9BACI|nr:TetR/AcrR family transcriptional regulator [Oceanobacillus piezotolerans]RLL42866.1 TetR/AcrR family transcriptional regulator [Oceanobacillus piezotolerans]
MSKDKIVSNIKDQELVRIRRDQMIKGAITLFKEKGFHRTTTREIAQASGFSIGTLYEYIRTKEDVLFLTCDAIYDQVKERVEASIALEQPTKENLIKIVTSYFCLMDELQEEILILYQEAKSLKKETRHYVLQKERDMVSMLERALLECVPDLSNKEAALIANNIFVQGHMWSFRRWIIQKQYTLREYIGLQVENLLKTLPN